MSDRTQSALTVARDLVGERYPDAVQAWLGGSAATGMLTPTSDLDITVLFADGAEVYRESLTYRGWPVELFVHTDDSVRHFVAADAGKRRPTMARLVAHSVPLLPGDGGERLRAHCTDVIAQGPGRLARADLDFMRYGLTDLLDDLTDVAGPSPTADAVVVAAWRLAAEFVLAAQGRWTGSGKWLMREVEAMDAEQGTEYALDLSGGLSRALRGDVTPLTSVIDRVLAEHGGRLWSGFKASADL